MADASPDTLVAAIRAVSRGEVYLSGKVKPKVLKGFLETAWNAGDEASTTRRILIQVRWGTQGVRPPLHLRDRLVRVCESHRRHRS